MTESYGIIHAVDERLMGTELLAAADDEDTVLEVEDVHDFVGDGERITVGDEQHVVVAIEESDSGPSTITIADGLADPWPAETRVLLHPPSPVSTAFVAVDGDPANQAVWHVPMALKPLLRRGVRAPEDREHVRGFERISAGG